LEIDVKKFEVAYFLSFVSKRRTQEGTGDKGQSQESGSTSEENRRICREKLLRFATEFGPTKISHSTR
jgi:hypothetical protein